MLTLLKESEHDTINIYCGKDEEDYVNQEYQILNLQSLKLHCLNLSVLLFILRR